MHVRCILMSKMRLYSTSRLTRDDRSCGSSSMRLSRRMSVPRCLKLSKDAMVETSLIRFFCRDSHCGSVPGHFKTTMEQDQPDFGRAVLIYRWATTEAIRTETTVNYHQGEQNMMQMGVIYATKGDNRWTPGLCRRGVYNLWVFGAFRPKLRSGFPSDRYAENSNVAEEKNNGK